MIRAEFLIYTSSDLLTMLLIISLPPPILIFLETYFEAETGIYKSAWFY